MHPRLLGTTGALAAALAVGPSCAPPVEQVPLDAPAFPTGLALAGDHLLVVSSNFDLRYEDGALLSADLVPVREATKTGDGNVVVQGAYDDAVLLPPFGDKPTVTSGGERAYVPTRGANRVTVVDVSNGVLTCGSDATDDAEAAAPRCGDNNFSLQLSDNDPFDVLITRELPSDGALVRVDGLVTSLGSRRVVFWSDDRARDPDSQFRIVGALDLDDDLSGVRAAVLRPEVAGTDRVVFAAADLDTAQGFGGAALLVFNPNANSNVGRFDVSLATGAFSMRDLVLVPGTDGQNDALIAVLRGPDALARFEIDDDGGLPAPRLSAVSSTCRDPTSLAYAPVTAASGEVVDRVLVTCQEGDTIDAIDPLTLAVTDSVRFEGRGPYDVVVNPAAVPPEAYVSFFLDNSVGVLHLVDDDGAPRLVFRGRIGEASARPEDGRE